MKLAMNKTGINHIVSNDTDFPCVRFLQVRRPDTTEAPAQGLKTF
jgi:hypothetical protein